MGSESRRRVGGSGSSQSLHYDNEIDAELRIISNTTRGRRWFNTRNYGRQCHERRIGIKDWTTRRIRRFTTVRISRFGRKEKNRNASRSLQNGRKRTTAVFGFHKRIGIHGSTDLIHGGKTLFREETREEISSNDCAIDGENGSHGNA